jgi:hypothetical protein
MTVYVMRDIEHGVRFIAALLLCMVVVAVLIVEGIFVHRHNVAADNKAGQTPCVLDPRDPHCTH